MRTDARAIVPYRADEEGFRRRNLEVVLNWLASGAIPTVLVEHANQPDTQVRIPPGTERLHIQAEGRAFNKSAACNAGVVHVDEEIVVLVDADTLTSMRGLITCIEGVRREFELIRPFGSLVELDEAETERIANSGSLPRFDAGYRDDDRQGETIPLCGGMVVMRTSTYERVGGMDESFEGWGGEDDAFSAAAARSGVRRAILEQQVAFHLAHPRSTESRYLHPHYPRNLARARWWHEASDAQVAGAVEAASAVIHARRAESRQR